MKNLLKTLKENTRNDMVSKKRNGNYLFRKGFFYTNGYDSDVYAKNIGDALDKLGLKYHIVNSYEKWISFIGGAPIQRQSHWGVEVRIEEPNKDFVVLEE